MWKKHRWGCLHFIAAGMFLLPALLGNGWKIGLSPKYGEFQILGAALGAVYLVLGWISWGIDAEGSSGEGAGRNPGDRASS